MQTKDVYPKATETVQMDYGMYGNVEKAEYYEENTGKKGNEGNIGNEYNVDNLSYAENNGKVGNATVVYGSTPFDDVFRTECERMKPFLIPLINEMFGTNYEMTEEAERYANEHFKMSDVEEDFRGIPKSITDSLIKLGGKYYLIECQSTEDGSILVRLVEYNMRIALEYAKHDEANNTLFVELPRSALLTLRGDGDKKSEMMVEYRHEGQSIKMTIPVLNVQAYSADEIYDKKLYFLIPYYILRYQKALERISKGTLENNAEYDKICLDLENYAKRLQTAYESGTITEDNGRDLADMFRVIANQITDKLKADIQERMRNIMGGKVLELQSDRWLKQGRAEGRDEGMKQGAENTRKENIIKLAEYQMKQNSDLSRDEAIKLATAILS